MIFAGCYRDIAFQILSDQSFCNLALHAIQRVTSTRVTAVSVSDALAQLADFP